MWARVIPRNLAILFTETKQWTQSEYSPSLQWYTLKIKYYLATKMNNLQLYTKYGQISQIKYWAKETKHERIHTL